MIGEWHRGIYSTHEEAQSLARGRAWPGDLFPGVALPSTLCMDRWIVIRYKDRFTCALVWDVGPWCTDDSPYTHGIARPRAEQLRGKPCPVTLADPESRATVQGKVIPYSNGAGIDLFPFTAKLLGIPMGTNVLVDWRWVEV